MASGKFITLEGGEGAGKSVQAERLSARLEGAGLNVVVTREPGGSAFAEHLRDLLLDPNTPPHSALSEALLFYAARADHLETKIRPALAAGSWVISDRFSDSTRAYQGAAGDVSGGVLDALDQVVVGSTCPDLTVILDIDPAIGMQRADERRGTGTGNGSADKTPVKDRFEGRDHAFHSALRDGFLQIARTNPERCVVVDGNQSRDTIADEIWQHVQKRLFTKEKR